MKVAAFDIDGTLFRWSFLIEIVERLVLLGKISAEAYADARDLKACWRRREIGFRQYQDAIVSILEGSAMRTVHRDELMAVVRSILSEQGGNVYIFTRELLLTVKSLGYRTVAISGSVKEAVDLFAAMWKIDDVLATELEYDDRGFCTGNVLSTPIHDKDEALKRYLAGLGCDAELVIAAGDTMSDRGMLRLAAYPIAFNPEQLLKQYARAQGLVCVTERKDCITVLGSPGEGQMHIVPRFFSEASLAGVLPYDVGRLLQKRLYDLGIEHI